MIKSIRTRLQFWYVFLLLVVIAGLSGAVYWTSHNATFKQIDARLDGAIRYLEAALRPFPRDILEGSFFDPDAPPPRELFPDKIPPDKLPQSRMDPRRRPIPPGQLERMFEGLDLKNRRDPMDDSLEPLFFVIWKADNQILKASDPASGQYNPESLRELVTGSPTHYRNGTKTRQVLMRGPGRTLVLVQVGTENELTRLNGLAWQLVSWGSAALLLGTLIGWVLGRTLLKPIQSISNIASRISETSLSERIDTTHIDTELFGLAKVLNQTFERLQIAFDRQNRFTADASHELRTPLAVLQSSIELALTRERSPIEYQQTLEKCLRACTQMNTLVEDLLLLSRSDAKKLSQIKEDLDLKAIVESASLSMMEPAEQAGIMLQLDAGSKRMSMQGVPGFLGRIVSNLLTNAIRHTPAGGKITIQLSEYGTSYRLSICDTGCGIPEADLPHVFDRFYRVDQARTRQQGGNGLGLSICKALVEFHQGEIHVRSSQGQGCEVNIRFPKEN